MAIGTVEYDVAARAKRSGGTSSSAVLRMVEIALAQRRLGGVILDLGCGVGNLRSVTAGRFDRYVGVDVHRHDGFPRDADFREADLDGGPLPLPDAVGDAVVAVETVEHLENPRAFLREMARLAKPGGWVAVTTPNQLSLLSKLTLVVKNQFNAFQDGSYPAHITALLESDLKRMAAECGLVDVEVRYSLEGRIPGTARHYPAVMTRWFPRSLSDNVMMIGRVPDSGDGP